jgi:hypothetical protein
MPFAGVVGLLFAVGATIVLTSVVQVHVRWIRRRMMVMGEESVGKKKKVVLSVIVAAGATAGAREGVGAGRMWSGRFARATAAVVAVAGVVVDAGAGVAIVIVATIVNLGIVIAPGASGEGWG